MCRYQGRDQGLMGKTKAPLRSITPISPKIQKPKACQGRFSNLFFPLKIYSPCGKGKDRDKERQRQKKRLREMREGRRKGRRKEGKERRKEGGTTIPLVKDWTNSRFLDTPCDQSLWEILSAGNRDTESAWDCGWIKTFLGYNSFFPSLLLLTTTTTKKIIGKHTLKSCLWYNCKDIIYILKI